MYRTFRYPLRPTDSQEEALSEWLTVCCELYNAALQHRRDAWEFEKRQRRLAEDRGVKRAKGKTVTFFSQSAEATAVCRDRPDLCGIPRVVIRSPLRRCDRAFQAYFRRCMNGEKPGHPRFRSCDRYDSFEIGCVPPRTFAFRNTRSARIDVPNLGRVRFHEYRPLEGRVVNTVIKRKAGRWYVYFQCDIGDAPQKIVVRNAVGIDVGLTDFATLTTGKPIQNPRYFRKGEATLAHRQSNVSRRFRPGQKQSNGYYKAKLLVAKAHEHIKNQRLDHGRKLAAVMVAMYDLIAFEDLNIRGMVRSMNGHLSKSIYDAAWGLFVHALICKAEEAGKWAVPVDPRGTSQRCSMCGATVAKTLSERVHSCPCGYVAGRDLNAARNILALGRSVVAGSPDRPKVDVDHCPTVGQNRHPTHMQIKDFMLDGAPRVGLQVKVQVPAGKLAALKKRRVQVGVDGTLVGEFQRFKAIGRKVLVVLRVGERLVEVRPQDAIASVV